ncbi:hypothetical protein VIGAN_06267200 [Vigna angularis var. angularis]|uniref:Uncharacterized protein n=1 Tax=Vigna angularis var. angularis TaxID=157739 RepID=A0A0S3SEV3_PHAAN|nr:hypothetical protein VIGAN_06267200 [Vigna angularis var. angularis]
MARGTGFGCTTNLCCCWNVSSLMWLLRKLRKLITVTTMSFASLSFWCCFSLFLFRVPGNYISLSSMYPRSSLEWEFLNHVRSADLFLFIFLCLMLQ